MVLENVTYPWVQRKLGKITSYIKGYAFKSSDYKTSGIRIIRVSDLDDDGIKLFNNNVYIDEGISRNIINKYGLKKDDIIITTVGSKAEMKDSAVGRPILVRNNYQRLLNQNLVKLSSSDENNNQFIYYQLRQFRYIFYISTIERGNANQANITISDLLNYTINISSLNEQKKIANLLVKISSTITLQQRQLDLYEQLKKGLLQKLFPSDGEKMPKVRFANFHEDWCQHKVGDISKTFSGGTPKINKKENYNGSIPFIRSAEITKNKTELSITQQGLDNSSAKIVHIGDILYAMYGATSGTVGISKIDGAINQAILAIKPIDGYKSEFILQWLKASKRHIVNTYLQGGQGNLSGAIVKNIELLSPSVDEQYSIGTLLSRIDKVIALHQQKLSMLNTMKKFLLQKLFI